MDIKQLETEICAIDRIMGQSQGDAQLWLQRGRLHYRMGRLDAAFNDFVRVRELDPGNTEAAEYVSMISGIFEFRNFDIFDV